MDNILNKSFYLIIIFSIIICILFIPIITKKIPITTTDNSFIWPTPGYRTITCPFGPRKSPATGASTYHTGIDIGAPTGAEVYSICSGKVIFADFKGADGYTIIIENQNYQIIYGHLNPDFLVEVGQYIKQNELIANIGPKYIYDVPNNPYHDKNGPTNGAMTGPHLHLTIKQNNELIDPLTLLK